MIEVTESPLSPERIVESVKSEGSGCVVTVTYVGLIRNHSQGKPVLSVEYQDPDGSASSTLQKIADEARRGWPIENVAISHRIGKLKVGDINLVVAVASAHRDEGFAACRYIIDQFKARLPTQKIETYQDGQGK
ncbi:MAG TPA: molybdenum cofactor biosynthesis protein MoaE [Dehalococcoidia bacterium]|nr:molybdenum cofactor biosynthesis protein MoaE [Dehalococcoidia bacterium]